MPARDMAAYMRDYRARQKAALKAEKEAIEQRGGRPVFTTHSSGEIRLPGRHEAAPRPAVTLASLGGSPPRLHSAARLNGRGDPGGRRVPVGYDPGTYPITPPERPVAVNTIWQRNVERTLVGLAMDNHDLRARVEELEAERRRRETSPALAGGRFRDALDVGRLETRLARNTAEMRRATGSSHADRGDRREFGELMVLISSSAAILAQERGSRRSRRQDPPLARGQA